MAADTKSVSAHVVTSILVDKNKVEVNDHVYLAPEHLGESYYIGRIMEFCSSPKRKGLQARIAWFYRPKDIMTRKNYDPHLLIATMHSDLNPVSSIRGKCVVTHRHYIKEDLETYKAREDHFYFNQLYDRYIQRVYDVVPCETVQNVPKDIAKALKARYQFIVVEQGKAAELTDVHRVCHTCHSWCSSADSVKCAACHNHFHMQCLNPPLNRKPSKGFAWQCALCSRREPASSPAPDQKSGSGSLSAPQSPNSSSTTPSRHATGSSRATQPPPVLNGRHRSRATSRSSTPSEEATIVVEDKLRIIEEDESDGSSQNHMWPFRYFGIHTNVNDILDYDDRIYPRARSRIGSKYQANVADWVQNGIAAAHDEAREASASLAAAEVPKPTSGGRGGRQKKVERRGRPPGKAKLAKISAESNGQNPALSGVDGPNGSSKKETDIKDERDERIPVRGGSSTLTVLFARPETFTDEMLDQYMEVVKRLPNLPLPSYSGDLLDRALLELERRDWDVDAALKTMRGLTKVDFGIVDWSAAEVTAFEEGIQTYGHELWMVAKKVPAKTMGDIVRFFYKWKKTDQYELVYSEWTKIYKPNKKFRKRGLVVENGLDTPMIDEEGSDSENSEDESDADPTIVSIRSAPREGYQCMNCGTMESHIWRRTPGDTDKKRKPVRKVLCDDCGVFWLKYGITRVVTEAMLTAARRGRPPKGDTASKATGKRKRMFEAPMKGNKKTRESPGKEDSKKRERSVSPFPPTPCAVCLTMEPFQMLRTCWECGLSVHIDCYGSNDQDNGHWHCDTCNNNRNPTVSTTYRCVLCAKPTKEARQALKKTSGNNWAHVLCATYLPEVKFAQVEDMQPVECIGAVNLARWKQPCSLCNIPGGACIACSDCKLPFHVSCAQDHGARIGFEMQQVKASRNVVTVPAACFDIGGGYMVPQVWCRDHDLTGRRVVWLRDTDRETGKCALATFVKNYKLCDTSSTGAMRKSRLVASAANIMLANAATSGPASLSTSHPQIVTTSIPFFSNPVIPVSSLLTTPPTRRSSLTTPVTSNRKAVSEWMMARPPPRNQCVGCGVRVSPMWWEVPDHANEVKSEDERMDTAHHHQHQGESTSGMPNGYGSMTPYGQNGYANGEVSGYDDEHRNVNGIKKDEGDEHLPNGCVEGLNDPMRISDGKGVGLPKKLCQKCHWRAM